MIINQEIKLLFYLLEYEILNTFKTLWKIKKRLILLYMIANYVILLYYIWKCNINYLLIILTRILHIQLVGLEPTKFVW